MTTAPPAPRHDSRSSAAHDIVAGLTNDGSAYPVARAAMTQALRRGGRVRFVQVAATGLSTEERDEVDRATFRAALKAMKGATRVPCTFEVAAGDPATTLVERSQGAELLVVGHDVPGAAHLVAMHCLADATCDVLAVQTS